MHFDWISYVLGLLTPLFLLALLSAALYAVGLPGGRRETRGTDL